MNVLLVAFGFYILLKFSSTQKNEEPEKAEKVRAHLQAIRQKPETKIITHTNHVYVTNTFHWSQLESADYREYIDKLRSVGCPEATIKDIILTDIMRLYAARRGDFYNNGREFRFWETDEKRKLKASQLEEREKQLAQIDKEIPLVLRELLGINYEREINKYFVDTNEDERRLSFVSEDKRDRLFALREEIEGLREKILARADGNLSSADRNELRRIEEHRREMLSQILSPAELQEFELRTSETADRLRAELIGFEPSEEEFRLIYSMKKAHDEKYAWADQENSLIARAMENEQREIEAAIRQQLGETRYAQYLQSRDPEFQNAALFVELYELPSKTAATLYEIQQLALEGRNSLLANPAISEANRAAALRAIRQEAEKDLLQILGPRVLSSYTQSSGRWVNELTKAN
ncbi:MAG: hypothetical protein ACK4UN_15440 [Limisphaerales bacterium]